MFLLSKVVKTTFNKVELSDQIYLLGCCSNCSNELEIQTKLTAEELQVHYCVSSQLKLECHPKAVCV